jgi:hypothetical protein
MKTRTLNTLSTLICGIATATCVGAAETVAVSSAPKPDLQALSKELSTAQSLVVQQIHSNEDPEEALAAQYTKLQTLCDAKFQALDADQKRYAAAEKRTNVIGGLISLLGSVTGYAPGKTVLMGLGISSSGSGSISSGITQFFSQRSTTDATNLAILQGQLAQIFDRYEAVDPGTDDSGRRRGGILSRGTNICMGLTPVVDAPTPTPTPTPS